jgi:hypothetical protein
MSVLTGLLGNTGINAGTGLVGSMNSGVGAANTFASQLQQTEIMNAGTENAMQSLEQQELIAVQNNAQDVIKDEIQTMRV